MSAGGSRPNAYRCADCGHHETSHGLEGCDWVSTAKYVFGLVEIVCSCEGFIPGACETCAGFGCAECEKESRRR